MRRVLLLFWLIVTSVLYAEAMPLIAYTGYVHKGLSHEEYMTMSACGFTHTMNIYDTLEAAEADLQRAARVGIGVFVHSPQVVNTPAVAAQRLKNTPSMAGYFLADEPTMPQLLEYQPKIEEMRRIDTLHPPLIVLHPYYADWVLETIHAPSYPALLRRATDIGLPQISMDFYPVTTDGLRPTWFTTLEAVRKESLRSRKPFWGFLLTVPHKPYPTPTLAMLRLQAYVNLAYGAQALQYFTYHTPSDTNYDFQDAIIGRDGKPTAIYNIVKTLNEELKSVGTLFKGATIQTIHHMGKSIPDGAKRLNTLPAGVKRIIATGREGCVVTTMTKDGHRYLAIVNKDYQRKIRVEIETSRPLVRVYKDLTTAPLPAKTTIGQGDLLLCRLD